MEDTFFITVGIIVFFVILANSSRKTKIRRKELLETVTKLDRGTSAERDLVLKLLKYGIPAQTIFHDLYVKKRNAITGRVTDNFNDPLPGVNVVVKGTSIGQVTDMNGQFTITVPNQDAVLQFSFVGYVTVEYAVSNQTSINIQLREDANLIEEVVVVGYGTVKKANLTGAVGYISGDELENRSVPSVTQALQGKVAGVNISTSDGAPGAAQTINLRGYTGLGTSTGPLVVIDGVQGGDLSTIDMNNVESISFLKDAASSAIYGSSAPYGVVIVTTKRGRTGKPVITYNNNFGFSQPINLPKYVNSMDFALFVNEVMNNSNRADYFNEATLQRIRDYQAGVITEETVLNPAADSWTSGHSNNDWFDIYFKKAAFSQQHSISASGATETSNYYVGLGYTQQDGLVNLANDVFNRYNVQVNLSTNLTEWLTFGLRGAFSRGATDFPAIYPNFSGGSSFSRDLMHQLGRTWPTNYWKDSYGNYAGNIALFLAEGGRKKETTDNARLTGEFIIRPLPGWNITANYTYSATYIENTNHRKTVYTTTPSGIKTPVSSSIPTFIERNMYKNQQFTMNLFTSYEKTLGVGHYFKVLAGFTQELRDNLRQYGSNDNLYSDALPMISLTYGTNRNATDEASQLAVRGTFGRINYAYREKYLLELNGRYDGTSRFLKDVRYKFYPGVSGAWVPSKETFWEPIQNYVNQFKLRASYASLGDQAFTSNYYPFFPSLGSASPTSTQYIYSAGRESAFWQPGIVNYDLTWITVNTLGLGVDIAALNNRLEFSFDWYNRNAKDFAGPGDTLPAFLGTAAPQENNAEIETRGFEITLGWRDHIGEFSYGANLVLSDYTGKVLKYEGNRQRLVTTYYDGMIQGNIWGFETVGLFKDQEEINATNQSYLSANWYLGDVHYKDLNEDGKLDIGRNTVEDPGDRKVIGNTTPRYSFGITLNAEWKGFDASVFLQGVGKRDVMFTNGNGGNFFWGVPNANEWQMAYFTVHTDRWTKENPDGYYPRYEFSTAKNLQPQTRYLQNVAYLRVKNIQLGYTLPKEITNKIKFQRARIFVNIENLTTFTKLMKIIDPEMAQSDVKPYPMRRTWAFGANVTF